MRAPTVLLKNGERLAIFVEHAVGSVEKPMSDRQLEEKFHGLADGILPAGQTREIIDLCRRADSGRLRRYWLIEHHHLRDEGFHIAYVRQAASSGDCAKCSSASTCRMSSPPCRSTSAILESIKSHGCFPIRGAGFVPTRAT
jgi:hypothetical protein